MKRLNGRRMILWIMTLVLCVTTCVPAFASVGDRTLIRGSRNGSGDVNIRGILPLGDGFCIITDGMNGQSILKYANIQSEPEKFVKPSWEPSEDMEGLMEGEGELNAEAEGLPEANPEGTEEGTAVPAVSEENGEKTETPAAQEEPQEEMDFSKNLTIESSNISLPHLIIEEYTSITTNGVNVRASRLLHAPDGQ